MTDSCPVCKQICVDSSIQCVSCKGWVHHKNKRNCSGLTNREFKLHCDDPEKIWQCDFCCCNSRFALPFSHLDEENWLSFNETNKKQMSDDVNILSATSVDFASLCESVHNMINFDSDDDDILLNNVNSKYYDLKQFNKTKIDLPSSFGLFHANIASLNKHIDDLKLIMSKLDFKFDVIGISEHKIRKDTEPSNNISISGYNPFIFEPTETSHGGTGFYIKDNVDYVPRKDLQINSPGNHESIFIEIQLPKKKNLIIGCIYRHPSSHISVQDFTNQHLEYTLQKITVENKQCVPMGDFNVDLLKINSHSESNEFYNNLSSYFFTPYILEPTRLDSKTIIDNIFFNSLEYHSLSGNLLIEFSDHLVQFLILEGFVREKSLPEINLYKRDFRNFNEREFLETVINFDWVNICNLNADDPNLSCNNFFNIITFLLDEFSPFKKVTKNEYRLMLKPWISKEILQKCKRRDFILKCIAKEKDPTIISNLRIEYKKLRNEVTMDKRVSKKSYYSTYFERNKLKSSEIWKGIRSLVNIKASKVSSVKLLNESHNIISDSREISTIFNNYFSTIGPSIESKIPSVPGSFRDYFEKKDETGKQFINPLDSIFFLSY